VTPTDTIGDDVRLYRGDAMLVLPTFDDESFDAVITDPPYGMSFQSARRTEKTERFDVIANDDAPFVWWLRDAARVIKPGGCLVCFCRWDSAEAFRQAIGWAGLKVGAQLVWDRVVHGMGDLTGRPSPQHDTIWFAVKGRYKLPGVRPTSVYRHQRLGGDELRHSNEKPVSLMRQIVADYVPPGGRVLDPYMGSGTTIQAAMREGRKAVGVELDPGHYATALKRLRAATGAGPGQLFGGA
jgi:DNA modification methylase